MLSTLALALLVAAPKLPSPAFVTIGDAELKGYQAVWALSDVHGSMSALTGLLSNAKLAAASGGSLKWNVAASKQLVIAVGDYMNGGPDSVAVVLALRDLQGQAKAAGSKLLVLLGNQEAELLSDPEKETTPEVLKSARPFASQLGLGDKVKPKELAKSAFGDYLRTLPAGAMVGRTLFIHSGDLDEKGPYKAAEKFAARDQDAYASLLGDGSLIGSHNWWKKADRFAKVKDRWAKVGVSALVIGHDPDALGAMGQAAQSRDGWLIKLDAGIKDGLSKGRIVRCPPAAISTGALLDGGKPVCTQLADKGSPAPLPLK